MNIYICISSVPSKPPRKVQVIVHSSTSMKVTWSKPLISAIHGELLGYKVNYWRADHPAELGPIVLKGTESSVLLRNLKKYTRYKVTVLAFTRKGDGVPSDEIEETTEEDSRFLFYLNNHDFLKIFSHKISLIRFWKSVVPDVYRRRKIKC